ncbi:hypothetical protein JEQ12_012851 [Ovis aries]|uniref:Uncharacterized protein n=1 Tax=Ovis aries TaxID=9940 RepID=A0A836CPY6_SHEEP|nr:hypothetical protein JEQ12_012851 [Ovis aries]
MQQPRKQKHRKPSEQKTEAEKSRNCFKLQITEGSISAFRHPLNRPLCLEAPVPLKARELRAVGERDDSRKAALLSAASNAVIHGAGQLCITEANWASVIGSLLSRKRLLQKGLQPPVARPARSR